MENVILTEEDIEQKRAEDEAAQQEYLEKKKAANTTIQKLGKIVNNSTTGRFKVADSQEEEGGEEDTPQAGEEETAEAETEETSDSDDETGEEETETTGETETKEEEEAEEETKAELPEAIVTGLSEAFPDEEITTPEQASEKIAQLTAASKDLAKEREANKKVYDLFSNSQEMVALARHMDGGKSFIEALAATVDIETKLTEIKETDPEKYKKILKAQAERELQAEQAEKKQKELVKEFKDNEQASQETIDGFVTDNEIDKSHREAILSTMDTHFSNLTKGIISKDFLQVVHRGLSYADREKEHEAALEKAREEGRLEGRNEKIKAKKTEKKGDLPDLKKGGPRKQKKTTASRGKKAIASIARGSRSTFA